MDYNIERIDETNYCRFDDMVFRREKGYDRATSDTPISDNIKNELANPNLYVYAIEDENRYVGWISLIYMPKVGKWNGNGHLYVDELWIDPEYRGKGLGKALMKKADEMKKELKATGIRLYVNVDNYSAINLYKNCGFLEAGQTYFMEK
ncbi:MAG: GNAT family N-acetyltransferase [Lachnospiraceae bacterium]|nr:GNAT family N-acetyltransferase [Lachnospiraceae bacterium]